MRKHYRYFVFALALGYAIRMIVFSDYAEPLGPFRFLTIWALLFSLVSAWLMLRRSLGLPYPFLNDLELAGRMTFYGANAAVSLVFLAGFCALAWAVRRLTSEARSAQSDSRDRAV